MVLLVWVYYSTQILLFGAELTFVYAQRFGHGVRRPARWSRGAADKPSGPAPRRSLERQHPCRAADAAPARTADNQGVAHARHQDARTTTDARTQARRRSGTAASRRPTRAAGDGCDPAREAASPSASGRRTPSACPSSAPSTTGTRRKHPLTRENDEGYWYADVPGAKVGDEYRFA